MILYVHNISLSSLQHGSKNLAEIRQGAAEFRRKSSLGSTPLSRLATFHGYDMLSLLSHMQDYLSSPKALLYMLY
jgi:hypothetical protein